MGLACFPRNAVKKEQRWITDVASDGVANQSVGSSRLIASPPQSTQYRPTLLPTCDHNDHHRVCPSADKLRRSFLDWPLRHLHSLAHCTTIIIHSLCKPLSRGWLSYCSFSRVGNDMHAACSHYLGIEQQAKYVDRITSGYRGDMLQKQCVSYRLQYAKRRGRLHGARTRCFGLIE